jgi:uncharacterized protein YndB with AHSA1/START domain
MSVWVGRAAVALAAVIVVVVAGAYVLPREVTVVRTVDIDAPVSTVFALVGDLRQAGEWSPWLDKDPAVAVTFTGPLDGVGQTMEWTSPRPDVVSGRETITRIESNSAVEMTVVLVNKAPVTTLFTLQPGDAGTTVTWSVSTDLGDAPLARYLGLWSDRRSGPDLERGLAKLKVIAEAQPKVG